MITEKEKAELLKIETELKEISSRLWKLSRSKAVNNLGIETVKAMSTKCLNDSTKLKAIVANSTTNETIPHMIEEMRELTSDNEHTKARMVLARLIGRQSLIDDLEEINRIHIQDGCMKPANMRNRNMIEKTLLKRARILFPDYIESITKAF